MVKKYNLAIIILPFLLFTLGFITLLSTSVELVKNQVLYFIIGLVLYFIFSQIHYSVYKFLWKYFYVLILILLIITYLIAEFRYGSARWIPLGTFSFQPSEFAKLALIFGIASLITEKGDINKPYNLLLNTALLIPLVSLIVIQPDLGTSIVITGVFSGMIFFSGLNLHYILGVLFTFGIFSAPLWNILHDYQKSRILVFLNPQLDVLGSGYNVIQSLIAVGSGGIFGKGFGRGTQASLEFLPAHWTDFIFASFAEEWGLFGVALLIIFFTILLFTLIYVAQKVEDPFAKLVCVGIFLIFFLQFTINVGMNIGVTPVTGVTLPLISYGGSSMLLSMISLGIVQNIWQSR